MEWVVISTSFLPKCFDEANVAAKWKLLCSYFPNFQTPTIFLLGLKRLFIHNSRLFSLQKSDVRKCCLWKKLVYYFCLLKLNNLFISFFGPLRAKARSLGQKKKKKLISFNRKNKKSFVQRQYFRTSDFCKEKSASSLLNIIISPIEKFSKKSFS